MTARPYDHPDNVLPGGQPRMAENEWAISERVRELEVDLTGSGTRASPLELVAGTSIPASSGMKQLLFVRSGGGPVTITANPRITAGTAVGQELFLKGVDGANTVLLLNGQGVEINGDCLLAEGSLIQLLWDGIVWGEVCRNDL